MQYAVCGIGSSEYAVCQSMGATENAHMHRVKSNSYSEQSRRALPAEQVQCKTENNNASWQSYLCDNLLPSVVFTTISVVRSSSLPASWSLTPFSAMTLMMYCVTGFSP